MSAEVCVSVQDLIDQLTRGLNIYSYQLGLFCQKASKLLDYYLRKSTLEL